MHYFIVIMFLVALNEVSRIIKELGLEIIHSNMNIATRRPVTHTNITNVKDDYIQHMEFL